MTAVAPDLVPARERARILETVQLSPSTARSLDSPEENMLIWGMSRSYRKPYVRHKQHPKAKQLAAKRVRRKKVDEEIGDGKAYRKESNSWDIQDFGWYDPRWEEGKKK